MRNLGHNDGESNDERHRFGRLERGRRRSVAFSIVDGPLENIASLIARVPVQ